jgi:dihydrofolate reductase
MITVIYSVACSVDGFIADTEGGVDWLPEIRTDDEDSGHADFFASIDAMVMGGTTYEQILGFGEWPYGGKPCWVLSGQALPSADAAVTVTDCDPAEALAMIEASGLERVWLVGGGTIAGAFRARNLIDECMITVVPVVLGDGVPLLVDDGPNWRLQLISTRTNPAGTVTLHYGQAADS